MLHIEARQTPTPEPNEDRPTAETRVGIRELRHDFRAWLDRVRAGEHIVITDRVEPIAELVPHQPKRTWFQQMLDSGQIIRAKHPPRAAWSDGDPITTTLSDELKKMRDEDYEREFGVR